MDDEEIVRNVAREMFRGIGYSVTFAKDGEQAIDAYRESISGNRPFDAVILDLTIPGAMGGKQAIGEILKINAQVKVIASSGYSDDPVMTDPRSFGFSDKLAKTVYANRSGGSAAQGLKHAYLKNFPISVIMFPTARLTIL